MIYFGTFCPNTKYVIATNDICLRHNTNIFYLFFYTYLKKYIKSLKISELRKMSNI